MVSIKSLNDILLRDGTASREKYYFTDNIRVVKY